MGLYQRSVLKSYLASVDIVAVKSAYERYRSHFLHPEKQKNIRLSKEEQYQEGFLRELFVDVLGYTINPTVGYNLVTEQQNITDQKKADAAILVDGIIRGVVELKGTNTIDLQRVQDQAFRYYNNHPDAIYIITSNFEKLRFYIQKTNEYEEFNLFTLTLEDFTYLYLCISYDSISRGLPLKIKNESVIKEQDITKSLYKDYSRFKQDLFHDLCAQNRSMDKLVLFKTSQKLIDRFLFVFFCEDNNGLLPANSIAEIIKHWNKLREMDEYRLLYDIFKKYFEYINVGRPASNDRQEIFAYNGGLFSEDPLLDVIQISDTVLYTHVQSMALRWASPAGDYERLADEVREVCTKLKVYDPEHPWTNQICVKSTSLPPVTGDVFPHIFFPTSDYDSISIKKLLATKLTLVDLWASWCAPCRKENKQVLVPLWDQFHKKGFEIIGYALDSSEKGWKAAILNDGADRWKHFSHLKGDESPVFETIHMTMIPANFLLDSRGVIVAKNLHGESLKKFVEDYFRS